MGVDANLAGGAGAAQGLVQGIEMYFKTQNMLQEQAIKKQLANAQSMDAIAKMRGVASRGEAENYASKFGLIPDGSVQTSSNTASQSPQQQQGLVGDPNSTGQSSSQGGLLNTSSVPSNYMDLAPQERALYAPAIEAQNKHNVESSFPEKEEELRNLKFGTRSANTELSSQYSGDPAVKTARSSQVAMQQMLDNYKHPSPQGDASLLLNAYKIKFPDKPDVGSLEELATSQSVPDRWRNDASIAIKGKMDPETRKNLFRDGFSTFRANVGGLKGAQQKTSYRLKQAGISDPSVTYEPAIASTFKEASDLQKQIGPYQPPSDRAGGLLSSFIPSGLLGTDAVAAPSLHPDDVSAMNDFLKNNPTGKKSDQVRKILQTYQTPTPIPSR